MSEFIADVTEGPSPRTEYKGYTLPDDLYIPPDALIVILEAFEGPLDLLLYLIRRKNLNILDIPVAEITDQYMSYIDILSVLRLELAGDYLVMAATLAELKSRLLLPRESIDEEEEADPRAELVRRLLEYEVFKKAATDLDELPRLDRDVYVAKAVRPDETIDAEPPQVDLREVLSAFSDVLSRVELRRPHPIETSVLSVRERMTQLIERLSSSGHPIAFLDLFDRSESRGGAVVTLLALLELMRDGMVSVIQRGAFQPIFVEQGVASA